MSFVFVISSEEMKQSESEVRTDGILGVSVYLFTFSERKYSQDQMSCRSCQTEVPAAATVNTFSDSTQSAQNRDGSCSVVIH